MSLFKDKTVRVSLLGTNGNWKEKIHTNRVTTIQFPAATEEDIKREITYPTADGLILYFIRRIEKLEKEVSSLKSRGKSSHTK